MRVMHILVSNRFSGAENVVCQIISMLKDDGIDFCYCSLDGQIRDALQERKIKFIPLGKKSLHEFRHIIKDFNPDIIHAHGLTASFFSALVCGKIPIISHVHGNNFAMRKISKVSVAYLFAGLKAKHIFWVSQSSLDDYVFHNLIERKSSVINNIIDLNQTYKKLEKDKKTYNYDVIYVGRLCYPKNPQRLMNLCRLIHEKLPAVKIAIVGTGELENETKHLSNEYGLEGNVVFLGFQTNPLKMLHDSKVMIMTSRYEGLPMCALEAMALGVPIVSTPTDGLLALIDNGVTGYLSDNDNELAQRTVEIIKNKELHDFLSVKSIEKSKQINDCLKYKSKILNVYNSFEETKQ